MDCETRRRKKGTIKPIKVDKGSIVLEEKEIEEPLSPTSAAFHEPNFNVHILAMMGCKTSIDVDFCKEKAHFTLLKHPRFSSLVVGDPSKGETLRWVRTEVDMDKHIVVPNIDPKNIVSPDKFVEEYMYNLSKTTLDKSRPLWEIHILQLKLSEDVKSLAIFRIHHSLGDGTSLMSLMLALMRKASNPKALPTIPGQKKLSDDDNNSISNDNNNSHEWPLLRWILAFWWLLQLSWNTFVDVLMFVVTVIFLKDNSPLKSRSSGRTDSPRRIVYKIFSLDDMKLVKNALGGTINDVAVGITQAGLSRYLNRKYGIDGDNQDSGKGVWKKVSKHVRLRTVLIINIRPTRGIQALSDMMEKDTEVKWGNSFGFALLPFTIGLRDDPLDYIREAKATVDRKKNSLEVFYTHAISEIAMKLLGSKIAGSITDRIHAHVTIAFSNLVGPLEEIAFYGHTLAFLAPSSYGQPHEVMINFQSYMNKMTVVLAVDEEVVADPHQLCDDIVESLKLIKDAVIKKGLVNVNNEFGSPKSVTPAEQ